MNEKNNNNNSTLNVDIEINTPCYRCNGDCAECIYYMDDTDFNAINDEAKSFRMSLSVDLRRHSEIKISI